MPRLCGESDGYAHPDDRIDRMGRLFSSLKLHDKYGITFGRYVEMVENGSWAVVQDDYVALEVVKQYEKENSSSTSSPQKRVHPRQVRYFRSV